MGMTSRFKFRRTFALLVTTLLIYVKAQTDLELENVLEKIFSPEESSLHTQALRRDIIRRLYDALQSQEVEDELSDYKRSINSLARWGNLPGKRNLAALARAGYIKTLPDDDSSDKRSIASLAKLGQLPNFQEDEKRGIEALARNGELHRKREIQELIDELYDKRNVGSLARGYNFPTYGKRYLGALAKSNSLSRFTDYKRNIASLAREGSKFAGKRNVAALLRQDKIHGPNDRSWDGTDDGDQEKRNLASMRASGYKPYKRSVDEGAEGKRSKRQADYYENDEYASPVFQNQNIYDYEEMMKSLTGEYPETEKRFLGRLPQMGKPKTTPSPKTRYQ